MIAKYQMSMAREKAKFFLGLGLMISLFYYSMLRQQEILAYQYAILLSVTLAALVFDYLKVSQFLAVAKEYEDNKCSHDFAIQSALTATLRSPLLTKILSTELLTLYYAFFAKLERSNVVTKGAQFSYSKSSNAHDVFLFVALSQLPFLPLIHVFVEYKIGSGPAWLITVLTLWSVVWFSAQVKAVALRPIELTDDHLKYRFGLFWTADIPLSRIKMARNIEVAETFSGSDMFLSPLGSTKNVLLEFETPVRFLGPYMRKRCEDKAAISLDNPSGFLTQLALKGVATS